MRGKNRKSNIELARVLSMFLILVIHANMVSLQRPTSAELSSDTFEVILRYFLESIGIVSVNLFVLISGYFKIKPNKNRILSFLYQIIFFWGGMLLVFCLLGKESITIKAISNSIALSSGDWFIKAYLCLCIIAPILNTFIDNCSEKQYMSVLIWFYLFQSIYGLLGANRFFVDGYGTLSFIGLYLLAHYARNVKDDKFPTSKFNRLFILDKRIDILIFLLCSLINTIIGVISLNLEVNLYSRVYAYLNPLNVIGALYLFLFFTKIDLGCNKIINWLGASSFAVYLFHGNQMRGLFTNIVQSIYTSYCGFGCVFLMFIFLVIVYVISVVVDQLRIISWDKLSNLKNNVRL